MGDVLRADALSIDGGAEEPGTTAYAGAERGVQGTKYIAVGAPLNPCGCELYKAMQASSRETITEEMNHVHCNVTIRLKGDHALVMRVPDVASSTAGY